MRSAKTVRKTRPPEMTAWTSESGRHREGGDVEDPGEDGDAPAEGEPLVGEERLAGPERMSDVHSRRLAGTAMLVQEAELRHEGAAEGKEDSEVERHK